MHSSPSSIQGSQIGVAAGGALYNIRRLIKARWRAVELSQQHERPEWVAIHLNNLGNCQRETGEDLDEAVMLQHESFALFSRLGSQWGAAMALCDLGWVTTDRGDLEGASEQLGLNDEQGVGQSLNGLARIDRLARRPSAAEEKHKQAQLIFDRLGDRLRMAQSMEGEGLALLDVGHRERAGELLQRARTLRAEIGAPLPPASRTDVEAALIQLGF